MTTYGPPGNQITRHELAADPHPDYLTSSDLPVAPKLIMPVSAAFSFPSAGAWYTANAANFQRFTLPIAGTYRYLNWAVGTSSGNVQVGVSSLTWDGTHLYTTRVAHSGVIACPATGYYQTDLGSTALPAGEYALFLWCDNTTATFYHSLATGIQATRACWSVSGLGSGVPSGLTELAVTSRYVAGISLEAAPSY